MNIPWTDICNYWDEQNKKLLNANESCHDFYFDLFQKMLLHFGFQDDKKLFFLGYVTAKYVCSMNSSTFLYKICFMPSWKKVGGTDCVSGNCQKTNSSF